MRANAVAVSIGGVPIDRIVRFQHTAAFGLHTVAVLDASYPVSSSTSGPRPWLAPEWTPVTARLAYGADMLDWVGYVHHAGVVSDVREEAVGSVIRYTLIGTSLPMNEERSRAWKQNTCSSIVRQIGREHRLRTIISPSRTVLPYYAQAGTSDWKVLQDMSERSGYRLWVDGSTVLFVNPRVLLQGVKASDVVTFTQNRNPGIRDTLYKFSSTVGTMVPRPSGKTARQVVTGLDPQSKRIVKAASTTNLGPAPGGSAPTLTTVNTGQRVGSAAAAQEAADVASQRTNGWVTATALVMGSPQVAPGSIVDIEGLAIPEDQTGLWLVTSVTHRVLRDQSNPVEEFTTILELERDQYDMPTFDAAFKTTNTSDAVNAIMRNGVFWEAELMEDIRVG